MKKLIFLFIVALLNRGVWAETLAARVDRQSLAQNQTLNLDVEESGGHVAPDFSPLSQDFEILVQGRSSVTSVNNGQVSSSLSWKLTLRPKHAGQLQIPPLRAGTAQTQPLFVHVGQASSAFAPEARPARGTVLTARASANEIYKNQRVRVDYHLRTRQELTNLQVPELSVPGAIVERAGEPIQRPGGVDFSFYVTPMKEGALEIPPLILQGQAVAPRRIQDPFDGMGDDFFGDSFAQMQKMMSHFASFDGLDSLRPVQITSNAVRLEVKPPVAGVVPWLPSSSLTLNATFSREPAKVGEPYEMTVQERANDLSAAQLPSLEEQVASDANFKVYPGQVNDQVEGDWVTRTQKFTLIPQRTGALNLPQVKIAHFDPATGARKLAATPLTQVQVAPGIPIARNEVVPSKPEVVTPVHSERTHEIEYGAGALALLLAGLVAWRLRSSKQAPIVVAPQAAPKPERRLELSDLRKCASTAELQRFALTYSRQRFGFSFAELAQSRPDLLECKKALEADLYAGRPADVATLSRQMERAFNLKVKEASDSRRSALPELNPI